MSSRRHVLAPACPRRREGRLTPIFILHDPSVVRHLCDRAAIMDRGRIVEGGPPVRSTAAHGTITERLPAAVPVLPGATTR